LSKSHRPSLTALRRFAFGAALIVIVGASGHASKGAAHPDTAVRPARIPLSFEANQGQSDERVKFLARGPAYTLFLTSSETVLALTDPAAPEPGAPQPNRVVVRLRLIGGSSNPTFEGLDPLPARSHYFIGRYPQRWRTGVPHYARVGVRDVYPGIDQVFYAAAAELEYDLVVKAGADASRVRLAFDGADALRINQNGDLILTAGDAEITQRAPLAYQVVGGTRTVVPAKYVTTAHEVGIELGGYDRARPLVIDPVLVYSSFLGGSGEDYGFAIAVDAEGSTYLTGSTTSADFPTVNPLQSAVNLRDVFVTKVDPTGSQLVYSTFIGGSTWAESAYGIAVDGGGHAYVTGHTGSSDFPTMNAAQPGYGGGTDAFVAKLDADGSALIYSTYVGGSSQDRGFAIAVDAAGSVRLTGETWSTDFPTVNALQPARAGTTLSPDAFLARLDAAGTTFVYSTYFGGNYYENGNAVAVDAAGNAYVTGYTQSTDFPVLNAVQPALAGPPGGLGTRTDAFVASVDPAGALLYSTYLGGAGGESGRGIAVDAGGNAYVTGGTGSIDFPTVNAVQSVNGTPALYRSTDGGETWSGLGFNNFNMLSIAVDPVNSSAMYVATNYGIFKTTDGGQQWSQANTGLPGPVNKIAIDPLTTSTLYAATTGYRVFKSVDGGGSWTQLPTTPQPVVYTVAVDAQIPAALHAGMRRAAAKSLDGGATWTSAGIGADHIVDLVFDPVQPLVIWAGTRDDTPSGGGVFMSVDGGATWSSRRKGLQNTSNSRYYDIPALAIDHVNTTTLYAASGLGVYKTTDSGLNWQPSNTGMTTLDTRSLAIDPIDSSVVYAGTHGGGVFKSTDAGATWTATNAGFGNLRISVLTMDPTNPRVLYAGAYGGWSDAFLTKLTPGGAAIAYSTYIGGSWNDDGRGVAIDDQGNAYVAGLTQSLDFPIADAIQSAPGGPLNVYLKDAFVTKVNTSAAALLFSTYLGGSGDDQAYGVAVDRAGNAYVTGQTTSTDFPTTAAAFQPVRGGGYVGTPDAFVLKIAP
jgi:photosystem II stability/assembly factor-like uncharacterized protein